MPILEPGYSPPNSGASASRATCWADLPTRSARESGPSERATTALSPRRMPLSGTAATTVKPRSRKASRTSEEIFRSARTDFSGWSLADGSAAPEGSGAGVACEIAPAPAPRRPVAASSAAAGRAPDRRETVTYGSMRPGETVWPSRSITCASAGTATAPAAPTAAITPPRTITVPFSITFPGDVTTRAFTSAYTCGSSAAEEGNADRKKERKGGKKRREDLLRR